PPGLYLPYRRGRLGPGRPGGGRGAVEGPFDPEVPDPSGGTALHPGPAARRGGGPERDGGRWGGDPQGWPRGVRRHDEEGAGCLLRRQQRDRGPSGPGWPCEDHGQRTLPGVAGLRGQAVRRVVRSPRLPEDAIAGEPRPLTPLGLGWPNVVSVFRVLLVPALVVLILIRERTASYAAAAVFAVAAVTDGVDGYLARRFSSVTRTGQWLDPLADKLLVSAPVLTLTALGKFPVWAAVIIVAREIGISALRAWLGIR